MGQPPPVWPLQRLRGHAQWQIAGAVRRAEMMSKLTHNTLQSDTVRARRGLRLQADQRIGQALHNS